MIFLAFGVVIFLTFDILITLMETFRVLMLWCIFDVIFDFRHYDFCSSYLFPFKPFRFNKKKKWSCVFYCYFKVEKIHSWRSQYEQINSLTLTIYFEKSKIGKTDDFFHLNRTSCWVTHFCLLLFSSEFFFLFGNFFQLAENMEETSSKKV
jgi:hypothetical protein